MTRRRKFTPQEKVRILREHLVEKATVSDLCDRHRLSPNLFYRWQKEFFEHGAAAFQRRGNGPERKLAAQVAQLRSKLAQKDEVIAEIMASQVQLKKELGEI